MIKVVHLQKTFYSAGRAATRLHNAFLQAGIDSSVLSLEVDVNDTDRMLDTGRNSRIAARIDEVIQEFITRKVDKRSGMFSYPFLGTDVSGREQVRNADILYMHWVQGGFLNISGYRKLFRLGKPVIIFMHDMWTVTGGCHHSFECEKYKTHCQKCPMFPQNNVIDWASHEFDKKKKLFSEFDNLYFVSPSKWLAGCAKQSALTQNKPVYNIPNLLDTSGFRSVSKKAAREFLNIDSDEIIIAFGAVQIDSPYKGWNELHGALEILSRDERLKNASVLVFGSGYNERIASAIPFRTKFLGYIKDQYSMPLIYNAADVLIAPSLAETFGYVIFESLSCGTPVVSFNVGGIPDLISHKWNGYLARYRDVEDLADGVIFCLENNIKGQLPPHLEKNKIIDNHLELINSII